MPSIFRPRTIPHGAVKTCVFTAPCAFYLCIYSVRDYLRKPRLRIIAGSLALPEQIWKKQITLRTRNIQLITPYATGTIIVQKRSATHISMRMLTTVNLSACLTWNMDRPAEERRCFGYTAAVPERIRKCARRSWRKMWQRHQVARCN